MPTTDRAEIARHAAKLLHAGLSAPRWVPRPHQVPPPGDWYGWILLAGRGAGKTDACSEYVARHVAGAPCIAGPTPHLIGIVAPTQGDAVKACVNGPSGIKAHDPSARGPITTTGGTVVRWPNGSVAYLLGANTPEDVERLRASGNTCLVWAEELAAWRYLDATWDQMRFGLRSGPRPHWVASTTPKPKNLIKRLAKGEIENVVKTYATMYDNPHLPQHIKDALEDAYAGTQLGEQELYGRLLEEDKNALWSLASIAAARVRSADLPDLARLTVGVDPSGGAGEQGIVVSGKAVLPGIREVAGKQRPAPLVHGYVLADNTVCLPPEGWARRAVETAVEWDADDICVEVNYGGDMAVSTIRTAAEALGVSIPIRQVRATRGKAVRAQPVAALTAQNRWHHAGTFERLEEQLVTWYPELDWSPDRLDGMVWGAWHNKVVGVLPTGQGRGLDSRTLGRRIA